jgi:PilZ domain
MQERRTAPRFRTSLNVRWKTLRTQGRGEVCDISSSGCFILTGGHVQETELVHVEMLLPNEIATLRGKVVYTINEMGFAVHFLSESPSDERSLGMVLQNVDLA